MDVPLAIVRLFHPRALIPLQYTIPSVAAEVACAWIFRGGIEAFGGPFGVRIEAGDEMYFNNGTQHNLRVTFAPTIRF